MSVTEENKTDNEAIYEMIKEQSGIDFEVRVIPQDSWAEQVNLMIVGGETWDVLNITEDAGNWSQYVQKMRCKAGTITCSTCQPFPLS